MSDAEPISRAGIVLPLLTVQEVARQLGLSERQIRRILHYYLCQEM